MVAVVSAPAARQLGLPPSAEEMLADARVVIRLLVDELLTFKSAGSAHKALRSAYSPRGVCQTARGGCSPICKEWHTAIETGAGWIAAYDARGEGQG